MKEEVITISDFWNGLSKGTLKNARYFIYRVRGLTPVAVVDYYNDSNFRLTSIEKKTTDWSTLNQ